MTTSIDTLIEERLRTELGTPRSEQAHIVTVPEGQPDETPQAYVMRARIDGFAITALCGYTWVPNKVATGLPVCQECLDAYELEGLGSSHGEDSDEGFHRLPDE